MTRKPATRAPERPEVEADRAALEPVLAGDRASRAAFVDRFARLVYAVIERTLKTNDDGRARRDQLVEDLFAEVFVALFDRDARRLRQWSGRCSLASWVRLCAASVTVDRMRRLEVQRANEGDAPELEALAAEGDAALELLVRAEELAAIGRALARLSESDRALLVAIYVDELAPGEVAVRLGIAPGALYTRKNRALERLRAALAEVLAEGL